MSEPTTNGIIRAVAAARVAGPFLPLRHPPPALIYATGPAHQGIGRRRAQSLRPIVIGDAREGPPRYVASTVPRGNGRYRGARARASQALTFPRARSGRRKSGPSRRGAPLGFETTKAPFFLAAACALASLLASRLGSDAALRPPQTLPGCQAYPPANKFKRTSLQRGYDLAVCPLGPCRRSAPWAPTSRELGIDSGEAGGGHPP